MHCVQKGGILVDTNVLTLRSFITHKLLINNLYIDDVTFILIKLTMKDFLIFNLMIERIYTITIE